MPKALERRLMAEAKQKGLIGDRRNAYVYGNKTMKSYMKKKRKG